MNIIIYLYIYMSFLVFQGDFSHQHLFCVFSCFFRLKKILKSNGVEISGCSQSDLPSGCLGQHEGCPVGDVIKVQTAGSAEVRCVALPKPCDFMCWGRRSNLVTWILL